MRRPAARREFGGRSGSADRAVVIPQIQPWIEAEEVQAVARAVATTFVTEQGATREFEQKLRELSGAKHVVAYCNASCALFAVLRALGIGPGDEVLVPDMTFVATANAVVLAGATPVFCDVDPQTLMLSADSALCRLTPRTRAILFVHLYGLSIDVAPLLELARRHGLCFVEDAAQAVGVRHGGRHAGTAGRAGVLSFYGNKTITTGEGGAILTDDAELAEACYRLKNHGRLQKGVFVHEQVGFNFSFTDMQAALGVAQLARLPRVIDEKRRIRARYEQRLAGLPGLRMQAIPSGCEPVFWFTNVICRDAASLQAALREAEIQSRRFFHPLHRQPCFGALRPAACPQSAAAHRQGLSLPSACGLREEQIDEICRVIERWAMRPESARDPGAGERTGEDDGCFADTYGAKSRGSDDAPGLPAKDIFPANPRFAAAREIGLHEVNE